MKEAIQKAKEGGYHIRAEHELMFKGTIDEMLLDPLFWQALGKSLGWGKFEDLYFITGDVDIKFNYISPDSTIIETVERNNQENRVKLRIQKAIKIARHDDWEAHWHRFIDHLAEGKDAESFFVELLKVTKE